VSIRVEASGPNARLSHGAADMLINAFPKEAIDGHSIQLYFTTLLARECQMALNVTTSPEKVTLTAVPAPRASDGAFRPDLSAMAQSPEA
jgi:histidine phosphotransferase ChpT